MLLLLVHHELLSFVILGYVLILLICAACNSDMFCHKEHASTTVYYNSESVNLFVIPQIFYYRGLE